MTLVNLIRLLPAGRPDRDLRVRSRGRHSTIRQERDCVHRAGVKTKHLLRDFGLKRPSDGSGVEAARQDTVAVTGNRNRPHRSAVTCQLRMRRR